MAKLTKSQTPWHEQACTLREKDELIFDEKWFALENWHEGASHLNTAAGAFFTPVDLACDFKLEICGSKVFDLASELAAFGAFIVPQKSAGFVYSGVRCYERRQSEEYRRFARPGAKQMRPL